MKEFKKIKGFVPDLENDDVSDIEDFIQFVQEGQVNPDDGGICDVIVDGMTTNIHLGIWMCSKEYETDASMTLLELSKIPGSIQVNWANK